MKKSTIKHLVYEHILDQIQSSNPVAAIAEESSFSLSQEMINAIQALINPLIVEIKNRLPSFSLSKAIQNKNPFGVLPVLRHILSKYEALIAENSVMITHGPQSETSEDASKNNEKEEGKKTRKNEQRFVPPRLFSIFPNPGFQWRFIKIDSQNVAGIFPDASLKKQTDETLFSYTQRRFYKCFNFAKLRIRR